MTIVAEVGELSRFAKPTQLMGYSGAVASENSSGGGPGGAASRRPATPTSGASSLKRRGRIGRPSVGGALRKRQAMLSDDVKEIAWKAQHRLHARYRTLLGRGKCKQHVVTAVGRELLGFIWAIGVAVEPTQRTSASFAA